MSEAGRRRFAPASLTLAVVDVSSLFAGVLAPFIAVFLPLPEAARPVFACPQRPLTEDFFTTPSGETGFLRPVLATADSLLTQAEYNVY